MSMERVKAYAKEKGFDSAEKVGVWNGYVVYSPFLESINGITPPSGLPTFILEKDEKLKWVTGKKAFDILDKI